MVRKEFVYIRKQLGKTQKQLAELLGTSVKAVQSYEQGWRNVSPSVERQLLFIISKKRGSDTDRRSCWVIKKCPPERRKHCPAWEFQAGTLCLFINGTICEGVVQKNWREKMTICRSCEVFMSLLGSQG